MKPQEQTYSKSRRLKNQIKAVVTNPYNIIVLIAVVLLVYLIVLPLLDMIATTFELAQRDIRAVGGGKAGDFTLYYWQRLLASELSWTMLIKPLINSLVIGVCVSVCAILLGSILAWLMVRSDLPFKKFFSLGELAQRVDITMANLSILKNNKARAIRFSTLEAICAALDCQPGDILEYVEDSKEEKNN